MTEDPRVTWLRLQLGYEEGGARRAAEYNASTWTGPEVDWPCPTVCAIAEALGIEVDRG